MEVDNVIPVLNMCRLCLNYSSDCNEICGDHSFSYIRSQIKKYLMLEITDGTSLPTTVCQNCIGRIQEFDSFCDKVMHHQQLLFSSKNVRNGMQLMGTAPNIIQLSSSLLTKNNGTLIINLQPQTSGAVVLSKEGGVPRKSTQETVFSDELKEIANKEIGAEYLDNANTQTIKIASESRIVESQQRSTAILERELDELASDDIAVEIHEESESEDNCKDDKDDSHMDSIEPAGSKLDAEHFKNFPTNLIEDSKLLYKGKDLLAMISRFYSLECDQCSQSSGEVFEDISTLCQHYADHHQIKGYVVCCNMKLVKPRAMALHMARHLQPDAFKCPECNKMLTCPKILQYHRQNHLPEHERPLACTQCPRRFSYSSALVAHMISHQPEDQRAAHVCDECGKAFATAGRLTTHVVCHMHVGQDFRCHICNKQFACRTNLKYHLTTHEPNVRRLECQQCGKWLKNQLCLRKHMVQHSSIRHSCTECDYSAVNRQCLRNHMRVQHSNDKPFSCDKCGKTFKLKNTLINHSAQHTGERKFTCPFCSRTFASSGNYYSHRKRMHPQELAALKLKQEEEERLLRENALNTSST